jgi:hypothetical protein
VLRGTLEPNGYDSFTHSAHYTAVDPLEIFGIKGKVFERRLFRVDAGGNAYKSRAAVKHYAMWAAGKAAYDNGYKEFSILIEDGSVYTSLETKGYVADSSFSASTYEINKYRVTLIILLITENDYHYVGRIFSTDKYYQPGSTL